MGLHARGGNEKRVIGVDDDIVVVVEGYAIVVVNSGFFVVDVDGVEIVVVVVEAVVVVVVVEVLLCVGMDGIIPQFPPPPE